MAIRRVALAEPRLPYATVWRPVGAKSRVLRVVCSEGASVGPGYGRSLTRVRRRERGAIGYRFCPGQHGEAVSQGETVSGVGNLSGTVSL